MKFRYLRADEVDARVATVKQNGISILLYKDARCDMNILDETVGQLNWKRKHTRDNANCIVSIWDPDKEEWVTKEDTGTESFTEKEKGLASDSFKRACFNWGIGRELYTAPFIWVTADKCNITAKGQGYTCYDRFTVKSMSVENGKITQVTIYNENRKCVCYSYGQAQTATQTQNSAEPVVDENVSTLINEREIAWIKKRINEEGLAPNKILQCYKLTRFEDMNVEQYNNALGILEKYKNARVQKGANNG